MSYPASSGSQQNISNLIDIPPLPIILDDNQYQQAQPFAQSIPPCFLHPVVDDRHQGYKQLQPFTQSAGSSMDWQHSYKPPQPFAPSAEASLLLDDRQQPCQQPQPFIPSALQSLRNPSPFLNDDRQQPYQRPTTLVPSAESSVPFEDREQPYPQPQLFPSTLQSLLNPTPLLNVDRQQPNPPCLLHPHPVEYTNTFNQEPPSQIRYPPQEQPQPYVSAGVGTNLGFATDLELHQWTPPMPLAPNLNASTQLEHLPFINTPPSSSSLPQYQQPTLSTTPIFPTPSANFLDDVFKCDSLTFSTPQYSRSRSISAPPRFIPPTVDSNSLTLSLGVAPSYLEPGSNIIQNPVRKTSRRGRKPKTMRDTTGNLNGLPTGITLSQKKNKPLKHEVDKERKFICDECGKAFGTS